MKSDNKVNDNNVQPTVVKPRFGYAAIQAIMRFFFFVIFGGKVINRERFLHTQNAIIASNHLAYPDPPFIGSMLPYEIGYLAKSEIFKNPLIGKIFHNVNAIPIRRGMIDRNSMNTVLDRLNEGRSVLIFPEGSRKQFKARPGIGMVAVRSGKPVIPVRIENTHRLWGCMFRRYKLRMIVGKPITVEEISGYSDDKEGYRELSSMILERINAL